MSKKIIETFKNFTIQENSGFKILLGEYIVSVAFTDHNGSETFQENGNFVRPEEMMLFTFDQADLMIFSKDNQKPVTEEFAEDIEGFSDYENLVYGISPINLVKVLGRVAEKIS